MGCNSSAPEVEVKKVASPKLHISQNPPINNNVKSAHTESIIDEFVNGTLNEKLEQERNDPTKKLNSPTPKINQDAETPSNNVSNDIKDILNDEMIVDQPNFDSTVTPEIPHDSTTPKISAFTPQKIHEEHSDTNFNRNEEKIQSPVFNNYYKNDNILFGVNESDENHEQNIRKPSVIVDDFNLEEFRLANDEKRKSVQSQISSAPSIPNNHSNVNNMDSNNDDYNETNNIFDDNDRHQFMTLSQENLNPKKQMTIQDIPEENYHNNDQNKTLLDEIDQLVMNSPDSIQLSKYNQSSNMNTNVSNLKSSNDIINQRDSLLDAEDEQLMNDILSMDDF